jgi:hypothetical protein
MGGNGELVQTVVNQSYSITQGTMTAVGKKDRVSSNKGLVTFQIIANETGTVSL